MSEEPTKQDESTETEKKGFFSRMVDKIDSSMKEKAEETSNDSCCGGDDKGGKCC